MEKATWIIAAASVLNVLVLLGYAISTRGIRKETQRSAIQTEKLAEQSRDALKLQIAATFFQVVSRAEARGDANLRYRPAVETTKAQLRELFGKVSRHLWAELDPILFGPAKEPQQQDPKAEPTPRHQSSEEGLP